MSKNVLWQCFVSFFLSAVDLVCRNNWVLKQFILLEKNSKKLNWESDNDDNLSLITQSSRREKIHCIYFWTVSSALPNWCKLVYGLFGQSKMPVHSISALTSREGITLYNAILHIARNFLETRENIKILTHPFYHINLD